MRVAPGASSSQVPPNSAEDEIWVTNDGAAIDPVASGTAISELSWESGTAVARLIVKKKTSFEILIFRRFILLRLVHVLIQVERCHALIASEFGPSTNISREVGL
jgi:hypothetical protein